jgi:autotransporter-associated beta strand protein
MDTFSSPAARIALTFAALTLPAMAGTINTFTGATDNLTGTNENYSLNSAPINGTAAGSYKDLLFTGPQLNLLQTNTNFHTESISVTNGSSYGIAGASTNAPTIRVGTTGSSSEVIAPFSNANVPSNVGTGSQDLFFLSGNSNLSISATNNNTTTLPLTVQLRQSGNFNIQSGSTLTLEAAVRQNGTQSITITGAGRTNLNGVNTYTGSTTVNGGTLAIGGSGSSYIYGYCDAHYKHGMQAHECEAFVVDAVSLAMSRDGSSGGVIRVAVIDKDGVHRRVHAHPALPRFWQG